jgi:Domain of unknown function (DUF5668)
MANYRCRCQRCTIRGLTGPAVLITIGILFLVQQSTWRFGFWQTWPVILLVIGAIKLAEALASTEGHIGRQAQVPVMPQPPIAPPPPYVPPPPPPPQG